MQESTDRIRDLQNQLQMLGYHKFQIQNIIQEVAGDSQIETLSATSQAELIYNLEEYINFARRCWRKNN